MAILSPAMLKLKRAVPADAGELTLLAEHIWRIHYPPIIGTAQVEYMLSNLHSPAKVAEHMNGGQTFSFVLDDEKKIGYLLPGSIR